MISKFTILFKLEQFSNNRDINLRIDFNKKKLSVFP